MTDNPHPRKTWGQRELFVPEVASPALVGQPDLYPRSGAYLLDGLSSVTATRPAACGLGQREQAGAAQPQQSGSSPTRWLIEDQREQVPAPGHTAIHAGVGGELAPTGYASDTLATSPAVLLPLQSEFTFL